MLTAHSTLRDRYRRRSYALTLAVTFLSIVGLTLALANGDQEVSLLGLEGKLQTFLAVLAGLTFFVSLVDLVVDWRRRSWSHADAASRLGELNGLYARAVQDSKGSYTVEGADLEVDYDRTMAAIEPLPDNKVAALKAKSNRKRAVFTLIDQTPGIPAWYANVCVIFRGVRTSGGAATRAHSANRNSSTGAGPAASGRRQPAAKPEQQAPAAQPPQEGDEQA